MTALIRRPRLTALVAAGLVILLVFVATGLSLRLPGLGFLDLFADRTELDYQSRLFDEFVPLRETFVTQVLGEGGPSSSADGSTRGGLLATAAGRAVLRHKLTNDQFSHALEVPQVPFTAFTDTGRATRESGEPSSCAPTGGTVWYRYTPPAGVRLAADTFGSNYAIALGVFSGPSLDKLTSLGCDSSVSGDAQVIFSASANRTYYVQITGLAAGGRLVFNLSRRGRTLMASQAGTPGNGESGSANIYTSNNVVSADGRYVAFPSRANNLVPGDTNGADDVFVKDLKTGRITRASVSSAGEQAEGGEGRSEGSPLPPPDSQPPGTPRRAVNSLSISADGRYVAFLAYATNLVPGDTNGKPSSSNPLAGGEDAFVHDMHTGRTTRVSVTSSGKQGTRRAKGNNRGTQYLFFGCCAGTAISADGRYVAFTSWWQDLVPNDTNEQADVFVHDMQTGKTTRVSAGVPRENDEFFASQPFMSADGRYVGFNGVAENGSNQVIVRDTRTWRAVLASFTRSRRVPNGGSSSGSISDDGRYVVYQSSADNIVPGDTNEVTDAFRADLHRRTVVRVSVDSGGRQQSPPRGSDSASFGNITPPVTPLADISSDGRFVSFTSLASNLVPNDTNGVADVFVRDIVTGRTVRASVSTSGRQGDENSVQGVLSRHGGLVVFSSLATNLTANDNNGYSDVFDRELIHE